MKKLLTVFLSSLLCFSTTLSVTAKENYENSNSDLYFTTSYALDNYTDFTIKTLKIEPLTEDNSIPDMIISFTSNATQNNFRGEKFGNTVYVYKNNELMSMGYVNGPQPRYTNPEPELTYSHGSGWSNYYYSGQSNWFSNYLGGMVMDDVVSEFIIKIGASMGHPMAGVGAAAIYSCAMMAYNAWKDMGSPNSVTGINCYYGSYHKECNILAWYGVRSGTIDGSNVRFASDSRLKENPKHTWNGSPWDYTQPSGCRVVVNDYAY